MPSVSLHIRVPTLIATGALSVDSCRLSRQQRISQLTMSKRRHGRSAYRNLQCQKEGTETRVVHEVDVRLEHRINRLYLELNQDEDDPKETVAGTLSGGIDWYLWLMVSKRRSHKPEGNNQDLKVRREDEKAAHSICVKQQSVESVPGGCSVIHESPGHDNYLESLQNGSVPVVMSAPRVPFTIFQYCLI